MRIRRVNLTVREWAKREGVPTRTARHWCNTGKIRAENVNGRDWWIPKSETKPESYTPKRRD